MLQFDFEVIMRLDPHFSLIKQSSLHRGVAIFFLIFTFVDFVFDFSSQMLISTVRHCLISSTANAAQLGIDNSQEPSSQPASSDEDCFHCCSKGLPGVSFLTNTVFEKLPITEFKSVSLPLSPPRNPFHPPRFV